MNSRSKVRRTPAKQPITVKTTSKRRAKGRTRARTNGAREAHQEKRQEGNRTTQPPLFIRTVVALTTFEEAIVSTTAELSLTFAYLFTTLLRLAVGDPLEIAEEATKRAEVLTDATVQQASTR